MIWMMKTPTGSMNLQKIKQAAAIVLIAAISTQCSSSKPAAAGAEDAVVAQLSQHQVNATLWYSESLENTYLYMSLYDRAAQIVGEKLHMDRKRASAVVLDLDETVLNNAPYQKERISKGLEYTQQSWDDWVRREAAEALPGALEFTQFCMRNEVAVFYISNRSEETLPETLSNLQKLGFPNAEPSYVMLKTNTSNKDIRRKKVSTEYDVLVYLGDQLSDFSSIFEDAEQPISEQKLTGMFDSMKRQFVLFPNPMYGRWEKELMGPSSLSPAEKVERKQEIMRKP